MTIDIATARELARLQQERDSLRMERDELLESDVARGEIIKRAMMALERAGIPNDVGDPDQLNMLSARIAKLVSRTR